MDYSGLSKVVMLEMIKQHIESVVKNDYDEKNVLIFLLYCFKSLYEISIKKEKEKKFEDSYFR